MSHQRCYGKEGHKPLTLVPGTWQINVCRLKKGQVRERGGIPSVFIIKQVYIMYHLPKRGLFFMWARFLSEFLIFIYARCAGEAVRAHAMHDEEKKMAISYLRIHVLGRVVGRTWKVRIAFPSSPKELSV